MEVPVSEEKNRVKIDWARLFAENPHVVEAADNAVNNCIAKGARIQSDAFWFGFFAFSNVLNMGSDNTTNPNGGIDLDPYVILEPLPQQEERVGAARSWPPTSEHPNETSD